MIERINAAGVPVVSVDVPSGVNASTGEVPGAAVRAERDGHASAPPRSGSRSRPGRFHAGSVHVASIGLEPGRARARARPGVAPRRGAAQDRATSTKYRAGSVLVVGGSPGLTGAPMLAALAAFRADAGYVTVAAPESALPAIEAQAARGGQAAAARGRGGPALPRARSTPILEAAERADAVALGPGPRAQRRHARSRAHAARGARRCPSCSTPTASGSSSRSSARARRC